MALSPIAFIAPNFRDFANYWLKAYEPGTTTPISMALDSAGVVTVAKLELNADGFLESAGGALVIPYIDSAYDAWLFPTEAEADANNTVNAERVADNITGVNGALLANSVIITFDTLDDAVTSTSGSLVFDGSSLDIKSTSLGNAGVWDSVLTSTVTPNDHNIVQSVGFPLISFVFRKPQSPRIFDTVADMIFNRTLTIGERILTDGFISAGDEGGNTYNIVASTTYPAAGEGIVWFDVGGGKIAEHANKDFITTKQAGLFGTETTFASTVTYQSVNYPVTAYTKNTDYLTQFDFLSNNFDHIELSEGAIFFSSNIIQTKSNTHWTSSDKLKCLIVFGGWITDTTVVNFDFTGVGFVGELIDVEVPLPIASTPAEVSDPVNFIDWTTSNKALFGFSLACITGQALTVDYSSHSIGMTDCYINNRDGTIGRSPNSFSPAIRTSNWFVKDCIIKGIAGQGGLLRACDNGRFQDNVVSEVWGGVVLDSSRACAGTIMSGNTCTRIAGAFKADQLNDGMGNNDYNFDFNCVGNTFTSFEQGKGASFFFARLSAFAPIVADNNFRIRKDYLRFFDLQGSVGDNSTDNIVVIEGTASSPALFEVRNGFPQEIDTTVSGFVVRNESSVKTEFIVRILELAGTNSNNLTIKNCVIKSTNAANLGEFIGMDLTTGVFKNIVLEDNHVDCTYVCRFINTVTVDKLRFEGNIFRIGVNDVPISTGNLVITDSLEVLSNRSDVYPGTDVNFRGFLRVASGTDASAATVTVRGNTVEMTDSAIQVFTSIDTFIGGGNTFMASGTRGNTNQMIDIQNVNFTAIQGDTYINELDAAATFPITIKVEGNQTVFDDRNALMPLTRFTLTRV